MNCTDLSSHVADPERLAALRSVALLDTPTEEAFDRLTQLAARFLDAPVALVSLIDADRQFFKSCLGLPEPWLSRRETPLSHSFCQHNRIAKQPLLVEDARRHPLFKDNPAIEDLHVVAYLGMPLVTTDGYVLGSFCVIDTEPRQWTKEDILVVADLADAVMTEIQLRTEIKTRLQVEERLRTQNEALRTAYEELERETAKRLRALEELRQRDALLIQQNRLAAMGEMLSNIAHQWRQPLNMLALRAQELPMTYKLGEFSAEYLEENVQKMMEAIEHMSDTIDNFRNFFSLGKEKVEFSVMETVQKTLSLLDATLKQAHITVEIFAVTDPVVSGYPKEFSQVLLNIIINSRDAFQAQKITSPAISIEIGNDDARAIITITDNAGGIPEEVIGKVFDPYFTTKGPEKGTGIGLYMSKMIVERNLGGTLTVRNVQEGAQFRIEM
ncbi:ATP-binding protein [Geomonas sp. RF6]|uniref:GAF domain-containing sensor histidine kinase n=1 Tax=Geomonas sp. RF6 TaxID=2897342 RepID=UPI001E37506E|nr:GAF domain-containing protein [Geomonas sp. RF6]UFS70932.1 ATP-binding protein [Geomonas sp. RF6]